MLFLHHTNSLHQQGCFCAFIACLAFPESKSFLFPLCLWVQSKVEASGFSPLRTMPGSETQMHFRLGAQGQRRRGMQPNTLLRTRTVSQQACCSGAQQGCVHIFLYFLFVKLRQVAGLKHCGKQAQPASHLKSQACKDSNASWKGHVEVSSNLKLQLTKSAVACLVP